MDDEQQMASHRRGVSERERLLELLARCAALAEVDQRLAQMRAGQRFAANRASLAAERGGFEQVCARRVEIPGQQVDFAEQGAGECLAAQGAAGVCVLAQSTRELGQARIRLAGVQHVLGDARVDVEHAPGELGHVQDLSELPLGALLP